jgi:hypothetical protein
MKKKYVFTHATDEFIDTAFLKPALYGDWGALAEYLEGHEVLSSGGRVSEQATRITPKMREFIAGVLRGEEIRFNNRPPKDTQTRDFIVAVRVAKLAEKMKKTKAIDTVAEEMSVDRRSVQRALERHKKRAAAARE